jgi:hypothetical protein
MSKATTPPRGSFEFVPVGNGKAGQIAVARVDFVGDAPTVAVENKMSLEKPRPGVILE